MASLDFRGFVGDFLMLDFKKLGFGGDEYFERYAKMMLAAIEERDSLRRKDAKKVFDQIKVCDFENPKIDFFRDPSTGRIRATNLQGEELDILIGKFLNHKNMGYFIDLILENAESARQSAAAMKRHEENRAMKQDVFDWLDTNMSRFKSMDDAATAIAGKVAPIKWRTARDWVADWKKVSAASGKGGAQV